MALLIYALRITIILYLSVHFSSVLAQPLQFVDLLPEFEVELPPVLNEYQYDITFGDFDYLTSEYQGIFNDLSLNNSRYQNTEETYNRLFLKLGSPIASVSEFRTQLYLDSGEIQEYKVGEHFYLKYNQNYAVTNFIQGGSEVQYTYADNDKLNQIDKGSGYRRYFYEYNDDGSLKTHSNQEATSQEGREVYKYDYFYDDNGSMNRISQYKYGDEISRTIYKHDDTGRVISETIYNENGDFSQANEYSLDTQGNIIKKLHFSKSDSLLFKIVYDFDLNGLLLKQTYFKVPSNSKEKTEEYAETHNQLTYKYDSRKYLVSITETLPKNSEFLSKIEFEYDNDGNLLKAKRYRFESNKQENINIDTIYSYEYDDKNNVTKFMIEGIERQSNKLEIVSNYTYEYEYDEYGNWTKMTPKKYEFDFGEWTPIYNDRGEDNPYSFIYERTYTYYDTEGNIIENSINKEIEEFLDCPIVEAFPLEATFNGTWSANSCKSQGRTERFVNYYELKLEEGLGLKLSSRGVRNIFIYSRINDRLLNGYNNGGTARLNLSRGDYIIAVYGSNPANYSVSVIKEPLP